MGLLLGNFKLIPKNITYCVEAVKQKVPKDKLVNEVEGNPEKLYWLLGSTIATEAYRQTGQITFGELENAVNDSVNFVDFVLAIMILEFTIDSRISTGSIHDAVFSKRDQIDLLINRSKAEFPNKQNSLAMNARAGADQLAQSVPECIEKYFCNAMNKSTIISVECPKCKQIYDIKKDLFGVKVGCEICNNTFYITELCIVSEKEIEVIDNEQIKETLSEKEVDKKKCNKPNSPSNIIIICPNCGNENNNNKIYSSSRQCDRCGNIWVEESSNAYIENKLVTHGLKNENQHINSNLDSESLLNSDEVKSFDCQIDKFQKQKGWQGWLSVFCIWWIFLGILKPAWIIGEAYTPYLRNIAEFKFATILSLLLLCVSIGGIPIYFFIKKRTTFALKSVYIYLTAKFILSVLQYSTLIYCITKVIVLYDQSPGLDKTLWTLYDNLISDSIFFIIWMLYFVKSKRITVILRNLNKTEMYDDFLKVKKLKIGISIFASIGIIVFILNILFFTLVKFGGLPKQTRFNKTPITKSTNSTIQSVDTDPSYYKNSQSTITISNSKETVATNSPKPVDNSIKKEDSTNSPKLVDDNIKREDSAESCYNKGMTYDWNGDGSQAIYWYRKSAAMGYPSAQLVLGNSYHYGMNGLPKDYEQAFYWYKKSAKQGDTIGQSELGDCYYYGNGTPRSYKRAFYWYKKSAEQGVASGQGMLGYMYEMGYGTSENYNKAFYWYKKSAEQGDAAAQSGLSVCYTLGYGTSENYNKAFYWAKKSAEQGDSSGQHTLGYMYEMGYGTSRNYNKAFYWTKKSAEQDNPNGQLSLGVMYFFGTGILKNKEKSNYWLTKAYKSNNPIVKKLARELLN